MSGERWLLAASITAYLLALFLPAVAGSGFPAQTGLDILEQGAGAWRDGVIAWYANPVLAVAIVLIWLRRCRLGLVFAGGGLLLALSSYTAAAAAEMAGRSVPAFGFGIGFYIWVAAFVLAAGAAWLGIYKESGVRDDGRPP